MKRTALAWAIFWACLTPALSNPDAADLFSQANAAFQANEFAEAAALYERLLQQGYRTAEVEYNLGNAHYRQGALGRAILHYERALLHSPDDEDVLHNLTVARSEIAEDIPPLPHFFLTDWWQKARLAASSTVWAVLALLLWWAGFVGLYFWKKGNTRRQKKLGFFGGLGLLLLSVLPLSLALSRASYEKAPGQAIVLTEKTALRSAPDAGGTEILPLYEGTKVRLLDQLSGWWQVQLPNGEKGWLNGEEIEEI